MGVALYRKYRSKSLNEIIGQAHITAALKNGIKEGRISHAYLFAGPRGVGKTSVARILAHLVNGLDYVEGTTHLDIIEIDAASNRRIDEIRELRERVHTAPASSKYKVYIIDEVHMLTREAFNALLKTLEEPPEHAIFILATTEAHKLPETIISRTQRFHFKPIEKQLAVKHLRSIAGSENIDINDEALEIIAEHGDGSFRDSISLLDQVRGLPAPITADSVLGMLGIPPAAMSQELIAALYEGDRRAVLRGLDNLTEQGFLAPQIAKQLSGLIRERLIDGTGTRIDADILKQLLEVPASHDPAGLLEIILLSAPFSTEAAPSKPHKNHKTEDGKLPAANSQQHQSAAATTSPKPTPKPKQTAGAAAQAGKFDETAWQEALNILRQRHNTLYSIVRVAEASFEPDRLVLEFTFPFHQKRITEAKNSQIIAEIVSGIVGKPIGIVCELRVAPKNAPTKPSAGLPQSPEAIDAISNIFGGAEVLE